MNVDWSSFSLGNAAGFIKTNDNSFKDLLETLVSDIVVGSITVQPRDGNPTPNYYFNEDGTSINALGLPNPGLAATCSAAESMRRAASKKNKCFWFSIAGSSPEEYEQLALALMRYGDIEINLGCPNVWSDGTQKVIPSFDLELMEAILRAVTRRMNSDEVAVRVKLSPYSDPRMIPVVAGLIKNYEEYVKAVITCNTFPNALAFNPDGSPVLSTTYGGLGGVAMYHIALGQASQFVKAFEGSKIKVILAGGINSGKQLVDAFALGVAGCQIGTAYGERGAKVFSDLVMEAEGMT